MSDFIKSNLSLSNLCSCCRELVDDTSSHHTVTSTHLLQYTISVLEQTLDYINSLFPKERLVGIELNPGPKSLANGVLVRKHGSTRLNLSNERLVFGFPDSYRVKMRTTMTATYNVTAPAAIQTASFKGNAVTFVGPNINGGGYNGNYPAGLASLFDASESGTGDTAPYTSYRVWGSKITVRYTPSNTTSSVLKMVVFPCRIDAPNVGLSSFSVIGEQPYSMIWTVPPYLTDEPKAHVSSMTTERMFGIARVNVEDSQYSTFGTNTPSASYYWNVYLFPDTTGPIIGNLEVELEHDVEFYQRALLLSNAP